MVWQPLPITYVIAACVIARAVCVYLPKEPFLKTQDTMISSPLAATLSFDLHPLYASILQNGTVVKKGDVLGLDGDLRRVMIAPFTGIVRLLVTGTGPDRRVKVFLSEHIATPGLVRR